MKARPKLLSEVQKRSTLSAEDRAFLDFVARLAVDQALRGASDASAVAACGAVRNEERSNDDGDP